MRVKQSRQIRQIISVLGLCMGSKGGEGQRRTREAMSIKEDRALGVPGWSMLGPQLVVS